LFFFYQRVWNHCQQATTGAATRIRKGRSTQPWQFQQAEGEEEEEEKKKKRRRKEEEKKKRRRKEEEEEDDEGASTMLTTSAPTKRQQQQQGGKMERQQDQQLELLINLIWNMLELLIRKKKNASHIADIATESEMAPLLSSC